MVVAQLAEWSLLTSEIRGSNPNIGKVFRIYLCISVNCNSEKTKIKKKGPVLARLKNENNNVPGVVASSLTRRIALLSFLGTPPFKNDEQYNSIYHVFTIKTYYSLMLMRQS